MWVIFILAFAVIAFIATLVIVAAVWLVHKVSNAMIREDRQLDREEKKQNKGDRQ